MTTAAKNSFGAELWIGPAGGALAKVAELLSVTPPRRSREFEDATSHDSPEGAQEFIPQGIYDPGEVAGKVHYIAQSAGDLAMIGYIVGASLIDWRIVAKSAADTADMDGTGFLTDYGVDELPVKGKQAASFTIKASGPIDQDASA